MSKIHVTLTADEINNGLASEPNSCPVALALNTATVKGWWKVTAEFLVWHKTDNDMTRWDTPYKVAKWINNFDKNDGCDDRTGLRKWLLGPKFKPIKFSLQLNDEPHYADTSREVYIAEVLLAKARREQSK